MFRSFFVLTLLWAVPALAQEMAPPPMAPPPMAPPAVAQPGSVACEPEYATLTIEIPTGRCAAQAPAPVQPPPAAQLAPPSYAAPQVYAPQAYAPPMYAPPMYAPAMPSYPPRYFTERYLPQEPRYIERSIRPLWITGTALWVATWIADWTVSMGEPDDIRAASFVPIFGPWAQLAMGQASDGWGQTLLVLDGIAQAAGFVMLMVGALCTRRVPDRRSRAYMDGTVLRF